MDMMAVYQEGAYERLCRYIWCQFADGHEGKKKNEKQKQYNWYVCDILEQYAESVEDGTLILLSANCT